MAENNLILIEFRIKRLFGVKDIVLDLTRPCRVLIGENGLGKTTILSILNAALKGDLKRTLKYNFESFSLTFSDGTAFAFDKNLLTAYDHELHDFGQDLNPSRLPDLIYALKDLTPDKVSEKVIQDVLNNDHNLWDSFESVNISVARKIWRFFNRQIHVFSYLLKLASIDFSVLYFPTYRRIESDIEGAISSLGLGDSTRLRSSFDRRMDFRVRMEIQDTLVNNKNMRFGMADVENTLKSYLNKISDSFLNEFSELTGAMISHLVDDDVEIESCEFDKGEVEIVLQRTGKNLSDHDKEKIRQLTESGEIAEKPYLRYFLYQLLETYHRQKRYDEAIKRFVNACNGFLVDKAFYYDESSLQIGMFMWSDKEHSNEIKLEKLSSGEKQLISIFAMLYLEPNKKYIVLIDEPELSLSISWQKEFLPTISRAGNCRQIVAVTHSPFIFSNEFEKDALGSLDYVRYQ